MRWLAIVLLALPTACTSVVWNGGVYDADRAIDTHITHTTQHDQIHGFARLPSGDLMMLGERYWYAVRPDVSGDLQQVLQANLPWRYQITAPYSGEKWTALPILLQTNQTFSSQFCLDYLVQHQTPISQQKNEINRLIYLKFQQQLKPNVYRKCFAIVGKVHAPQQAKFDQKFHTTIQVNLQIEQATTKIQSDKLARNILLTPFALAADAVSGMMMLPALILGDLF